MTELPTYQMSVDNLFKEAITAVDLLLAKLEKAQKDLETPPPHVWKHGDIFKTSTNNIMIYLRFTVGSPRTVCVVGICGGLVERGHFKNVMKDAKFLFNIKEKL